METAEKKTVMAYFPGCSLHGAANDFATSIDVLMDVLGIELREIENWNCCGASSAHKVSAKAAQGLVTLNIDSAQSMGLDTIFAPCAACYNRLRVVADETGSKVKVVNLPDLIAANIDKILAKQTLKLDMKIACYYGCLLNKPAAVFKEDCENPMTMENSLKSMGMTSVDWPFKSECCGASFSLADVGVVRKLSGDILKDSLKRGAEIIITSCPLCHVNLNMRQAEIRKLNRDMGGIPVLYLSELIALCMGVPAKELKLGAHFVAMPEKFEEKFSICHA